VDKTNAHVDTYRVLIKNFAQVADAVNRRGGDISFEWPTSCSLWDEPEMTELVEKLWLD
jgi:hypothetical protein